MGEPWFGPKRYGLGLSPTTPACWISTAIYVVAMAGTGLIAHAFTAPRGALLLVLGLMTIAFIGFVIAKSDRQAWRWRWGGQ